MTYVQRNGDWFATVTIKFPTFEEWVDNNFSHRSLEYRNKLKSYKQSEKKC